MTKTLFDINQIEIVKRVINENSLISLTEFSHLVKIPTKQLFKILQRRGIIGKNSRGEWIGSRLMVNCGYMEIREIKIQTQDNRSYNKNQTLLTKKGIEYLTINLRNTL